MPQLILLHSMPYCELNFYILHTYNQRLFAAAFSPFLYIPARECSEFSNLSIRPDDCPAILRKAVSLYKSLSALHPAEFFLPPYQSKASFPDEVFLLTQSLLPEPPALPPPKIRSHLHSSSHNTGTDAIRYGRVPLLPYLHLKILWPQVHPMVPSSSHNIDKNPVHPVIMSGYCSKAPEW